MNVSLLHLSIRNFYSNTMITIPKKMQVQDFKIKSSKFSNFFGYAFQINSNSAYFSSNTFSNFLNRPISHNAVEFTGKTYNNKLSYNTEKEITLDKCLFKDCKSTDDKGGCIYCENVSNVLVLNTDFYKCSASQKGGAICIEYYINCTISKCCFSHCKAETALAYSVETEQKRHRWLNIQYCTVSKCTDKTKKFLFVMEASFQKFSFNNITFNTVHEGVFYSVAPMNASLYFDNFVQNEGNKLFTREILPLSSEKYKECNFVGNNANDDTLFFVEVFAEARDFVFIQNTFKYFAAAKLESHFSLHDCRSDIPAHKIRMQNGDDYVSVLFEDFTYVPKHLTPHQTSEGHSCNFISVPEVFTPNPLPVRIMKSLAESTDYPEKFGIMLAILVIIVVWVMLCLKRGSRRRRNGW